MYPTSVVHYTVQTLSFVNNYFHNYVHVTISTLDTIRPRFDLFISDQFELFFKCVIHM